MKYETVPEDRTMFRFSELAGAISYSEPTDSIGEHGGRGEWYCRNQDCIVREVRVHFKLLFGEPVPSVMNCPTCGEPMAFHHWLKGKMLLPIREVQP